jgi:hypothetical protein
MVLMVVLHLGGNVPSAYGIESNCWSEHHHSHRLINSLLSSFNFGTLLNRVLP